jgi:Ca-activated chloride channel homolog
LIIENPTILWGIVFLLPVVALQVRAFTKGRGEIVMLGAIGARDRVLRLYAVKSFFSSFAFDLFLLFAFVAAADATWGERPIKEDRSGLDVVIAIDVSRSMLAADVMPTRLDRSIDVIRAMSRQLTPARIALVAFKGAATTVMPLTEDLNSLEVLLEGVGPALVSAPGTNIENGLAEALRSFSESSAAHRAIVLVSDGEALSGDVDTPLAELRRLGIPVKAIVTGSAEGAPVPAWDGTPVLDDGGRPVISRADRSVLDRVATRTGGTLFDLDTPDLAGELARSLSRFAAVRQSEGFRLVPVRRFRLFLGAAIIALLFSSAVRVIRWRGMF